MEEDDHRFYFTQEKLCNTPSRKDGIDTNKELSYRQQASNFIQDMGQRLQLSQLCINTAIVYMHRFYVYHSFADVHRNKLSISALFLAAKIEEQPRKLEHVIKVAHACLHKDAPQLDVRSEAYAEKMYEVVSHEYILLQTLGFVLAIEHPHTYVVKVCQLVKACKDLAQTSYIMATTSLHMTTMCLKYKPTIVACVCIHLACKWSNYMIEPCSEGHDWFYYVDRSVTIELLEKLTQEFIAILETSPHRFKRKFGKDGVCHGSKNAIDNPRPGPSGCNNNSSGSNNNKPEHKIGIVKKEPPSPGLPNSLAYEYCGEFEKKPLKQRSPDKPSTSSQPSSTLPQPSTSSQQKPLYQPSVTASVVQPSTSAQLSVPAQIPLPVHLSVSVPQPVVFNSHSSGELIPQESTHKPSPVTKDIKTNGSKENEVIDKKPHSSSEHVSSGKRSLEMPSSKHERREKHRKHSSHSSKDKMLSNHTEPTASLKVKIRKDAITLSGVESSQKLLPPVKAESPKKSIKIKIPKLPAMVDSPKVDKPATSAPLKIVLTKDKSGSGSYSTSHKKEHRDSKKRSHNNVTPDSYKNSHESSTKYAKIEQYQKNHLSETRPNKVSRHSLHRNELDSTPNSARLQHPNVNENSTFQSYPAVPNYQYPFPMTPPPPPPKLRGHNMLVGGKTNSTLPTQPPLPPPQPPPPPPPPE
ncbi:cyclin-T2 [Nephila pilipes]|uniref:Cyclin-T2 n=1 Tax=Nephila pilipes TaxID=299642 RepID=A0A8X6TWW4_NEPPI|nr:cyclin-T2 [Nephila pilipes]